MHRRDLLGKLSRHRSFDDAEEQSRGRIERFVADYPLCFGRQLSVGHVTGSAWIVDAARTKALLTHHRKLGMWLQLGGHCDGESDTLSAAWREAREESGLRSVVPVTPEIFDVDVHEIPARKSERAHFHHDVRYLFEADSDEPLVVSAESNALAWVSVEELAVKDVDASVLRMLAKMNVTTR
ncbi:MAG: 8-oxo-dGTP pyrophosphatase MutT (NUDIX family) [Hyphomicrobiaceae bacterium]|jgi:8-oxo-dGTP pyrophosphatase MutT (NUDIX family)